MAWVLLGSSELSNSYMLLAGCSSLWLQDWDPIDWPGKCQWPHLIPRGLSGLCMLVPVSHSQQLHVLSCSFLDDLWLPLLPPLSSTSSTPVFLLLPIRESFLLLRACVIISGPSRWMDDPVYFPYLKVHNLNYIC